MERDLPICEPAARKIALMCCRRVAGPTHTLECVAFDSSQTSATLVARTLARNDACTPTRLARKQRKPPPSKTPELTFLSAPLIITNTLDFLKLKKMDGDNFEVSLLLALLRKKTIGVAHGDAPRVGDERDDARLATLQKIKDSKKLPDYLSKPMKTW